MNAKQKVFTFLIFLCLGGFLVFLGYVIGHNQTVEARSQKTDEAQVITIEFLNTLGLAYQAQDFDVLFDATNPDITATSSDMIRQRLDRFSGVDMTYRGCLGPNFGSEYTLLFQVEGTPPQAFREVVPHWELLSEEGAHLALIITLFEGEDFALSYSLQYAYVMTPYFFL